VNFFIRFFVGYVLVTAVAVLLATTMLTGLLLPGARQSVEETLLQTANLLAEMAGRETAFAAPGEAGNAAIDAVFRGYAERRFAADIYGIMQNDPNLRIYLTDADGRVVFDSLGRDLGADYSRWHDVSETLAGRYGARTTQEEPADRWSSVMYVAAPVLHDGRVTGVLTVGKPERSFHGFIAQARASAWQSALWLFGVALLLALGFSYWMTRDLRRLVGYANEVAAGRRDRIPIEGRSELRRLAAALEHLRAELDGKAHVERVSQLLAHELKSPLAAVRGAVELLPDETDPVQRRRLIDNITAEAARLHRIIEGVLNLARAENLVRPTDVEEFDLAVLSRAVLGARAHRLAARDVTVDSRLDEVKVRGNRFMLRQAIANLLDNAIDFSPAGERITLTLHRQHDEATLEIRDHGPGIPDYALPRVFERFYSTPRGTSGERGTGLGLNFAREAARLHGGTIQLGNHATGGALARLTLPAA